MSIAVKPRNVVPTKLNDFTVYGLYVAGGAALPGLAEREVSQDNVGAKGERVHVLCACRPHLARLHQGGTLGFRLTRSLQHMLKMTRLYMLN